MRTARLALTAAVLAASFSVAAPARADAGTASPDTVGNDGTKTLVVTASGFYPADQESVVLHPSLPLGEQRDLPTTVTNKTACAGVPGVPLPNADCGNQLSVVVDTTNALPGSYDLVETRTDKSTVPASTSTRTLATVAIYSQPVFAATTPISPAARGQGGTSLVTVTGTGFADGITADFGPGTTTTDVRVLSPTQLTASVALDRTASLGERDVTLTSADDKSAVAQAGFAVLAGPVIDGVTPDRLTRGTSGTVTVTGSHFVAGPDFALTITGLDLSNVTVSEDGTQVTADAAVPAGTPYGPRAVRIRNDDGGATVLDGGYAVLAPPGPVEGLSAAAGDGFALVSWQPPVEPGSSPVRSYVVRTSDSSVPAQTVTGTSARVGGLANGTPFTFTVTASNDDSGEGAAATATATPQFGTSLALSYPSSVTAGQELVVTGRLRHTRDGAGIPGVPVALTFTPSAGAPFTRTVTTNADGAFRIATRATYNLRVVGRFAGRTEDLAATSLTALTQVSPRLVIASPAGGSTTKAGNPLVVTGSVSPNKAGRTLALYAGSRLLARGTIASNSTFRIAVSLPRGTYRLYVGLGAGSGNAAGQSAGVIVFRQ